jgi:DNA-binding NarL/FixJ family response regulator
MLIDNHPIVLWGLERLIETALSPMQVVAKAASASETLERLEAANPDVVLLDIDLSGEDGMLLIPLIKHSGAKVLVLTGSRDTSLHDAAMLAGASGVIPKADATESILKAIQKIHEGEIWLDRGATHRIFQELSRKQDRPARDTEQARIESLTAREREIAIEIAATPESSCKRIAERLHISEHTLRNHLASIYEKLGLSSRLQLFAYAGKHRLDK